jgi:hypothetical protein
MTTADAAVLSAMTARTIRFAPSLRAQAKQSIEQQQQGWIASSRSLLARRPPIIFGTCVSILPKHTHTSAIPPRDALEVWIV